MRTTILILILLFLPTTLLSSEQVSRGEWIEAMSTAIPTALCQPEQYFRQCFKVTQQKCEQVASSAARICLNKYKEKIPIMLNQPEDGRQWGTIIGTCTGTSYETTLFNKRINSDQCNDINNWQ